MNKIKVATRVAETKASTALAQQNLDVLEAVLGGLGSHFEVSWNFFGTVLGILGALVRQLANILTKKTIKEGFETSKWWGEEFWAANTRPRQRAGEG